MKRRQTWECVPCRRTTYVDHHGSDPLPTERQCQCKRPMGLVLFADADAAEPAPELTTERRAQA